MKISISGHAAAFNDNDVEITTATTLRELAGVKSDDSCVDYLDEALAEIGLVGGHLEFVYDEESNRLRILTVYHSPRKLNQKELQQLVEETQAQWSDGIGESDFGVDGVHLDAFPILADVDLDDVSVEQIDDGVKVAKLRKSPLFNVAKRGDGTKLQRLLAGGEDVDARDRERNTPLLAAVSANQPAAASVLIDAGAELNVGNKHGFTPVCIAATQGYVEILERLLKAGADANYCDPNDYSEHPPLHMACNRGYFAAVRLLVEHGADVNYQCNGGGYSAIMHLKADKVEIARYLVANGADTDLVNLFDKGMDADLKRALG
jgi:hypothetical protein